MTLNNLRNSPLVKAVEKRGDQYIMTLADGVVIPPSPEYAWPMTPTRFVYAKTIKQLVTTLQRAAIKKESAVNMRSLSSELGGKIADMILKELNANRHLMSEPQVRNFPSATLAYVKTALGMNDY